MANNDETLFICMGSACHQLGVYEVLPKLQTLLQTHAEGTTVTLKGSFCLELCSHGITMKFRDQQFMNISPQNIEEKFMQEILPVIQAVNLMKPL